MSVHSDYGERHLNEVLAAISASDDGDGVRTLEQRVARLIDGVVAAHSIDHVLHRVLLDEVPLAARSEHDPFEIEYR